MMKKIGMVLLFNLCVMLSWAQKNDFNEVLFEKGYVILKADSQPYTGTLIDHFENGKIHATAKVISGYLVGPAKVFYPNGTLKMQMQYNNGKLCCEIVTFYPNGELKLKAIIGGQRREGGNSVQQVVYGYYDKREEYVSKFKPKLGFQFLTKEGLSAFENAHVPPHKIDGFRLFDNKIRDLGVFIEDSRELYAPKRTVTKTGF